MQNILSMNKTLNTPKRVFIFALPLLVIATMVLITQSSFFLSAPYKLSLGITIDLLLTTPLIYFLLIRKSRIPKLTIVPILIIGVIICTYIIPSENQFYLSLFKTWILPVIELIVLSFVIYKVVKTVQLYKLNKSKSCFDFYTVLKSTCYEVLPKVVVIPMVTEIAVFYYGFLNWKKVKLKSNEFSYHKDSGTIGLLIALLFLIAIETVAFHLLLASWNITTAWVLTGISIYSGIQIFGFLKSMLKRPIIIENDIIYFRYGIMNESTVNIENIESIELSIKDIVLTKTTRKLFFLGDLEGHNLVIKLKKENTMTGLYGIKRTYKVLALHIDDKHNFKERIDYAIQKR